MKYRVFPGTSLEVSVVGMGCWAIGGKWWGDDVRDSDSIAAVHAALECGVNFFDTAPLYGHGHADEILLQALGSKRHDVVIATKVGVRLQGAGGHAQSEPRADAVLMCRSFDHTSGHLINNNNVLNHVLNSHPCFVN